MSANTLTKAYRTKLDSTRTTLSSHLRSQFEAMPTDDLDGAFDEFVGATEDVIAGGKSAAQTLTTSFMELLAQSQGSAFEPLPELEDLILESGAGSLRDGLAAVMPMVKAAIGEGRPLDEAMQFGGSLVEKFTDNEMTRTADEEMQRQSAAAPEIVGWTGIVTPGSCDRCQENDGDHSLDEEMYRHPGCNCERVPQFADASDTPPTEEPPTVAEATADAEITPPAIEWPEPDTSKAGVDDATSAWTGIHYSDLREYMMTGQVREGMTLADDPIHGISEERAAQAVSTLTQLIADGEKAPALFRGLAVDSDALMEFSSLRNGQALDVALSSWSSDAAEAAKFASRTRPETPFSVVLHTVNAQGVDMAPFSFYPGEKEWITNGRFVVDAVEEQGDTLVVRLRQEAVWEVPKAGVE